MKNKRYVLIIVSLILFTMILGCTNKEKNLYTVENFIAEMKEKGYDLEVSSASKSIYEGERKRAKINENDAIDIYIYESIKDMEEDAARIEDEGSTYRGEKEEVKIDWASYPHFYKKGSIMVLYVGENEKIINDLNGVLGGQFIGYEG